MEDLLDDNLDENRTFAKEDISKLKILRNETHQLISQVRQGRGMFVFLAVLATIAAGVGYFGMGIDTAEGLSFIIEGGFLCIVYGICAIVYPKNPKVTLIVGFGIYMLIFIVGIMLDPEILSRGIIMRLFIIYFFVKTINAAFNLPKAIQKLKDANLPSSWIKKAEKLEDLPMTSSLLRK